MSPSTALTFTVLDVISMGCPPETFVGATDNGPAAAIASQFGVGTAGFTAEDAEVRKGIGDPSAYPCVLRGDSDHSARRPR